MKKSFVLSALLVILLFSPGCSWLAVNFTPKPVVDAVARGAAVANVDVTDPPKTPEELQAYLKVNKEIFDELAVFYGLRSNTK